MPQNANNLRNRNLPPIVIAFFYIHFPFSIFNHFFFYCYSYIHKSRVYINIFWTRASLHTDDVIDLYWWACFDFSFHMFLLSSNRINCNIRTLTPNTSLRLIEIWIQMFPLQIICFDSIAANYLIRPFILISFSRWCVCELKLGGFAFIELSSVCFRYSIRDGTLRNPVEFW